MKQLPYLGLNAAGVAAFFALNGLATAQSSSTTTQTTSSSMPAAPAATTSTTSTTSTTTTSSDGTVSQFGPNSIVVKSTTSTDPVSYSYSKTTTYVDENGNPVSSETVTTGSPVTIYYTQDGDTMVANKVVVRKTTTTTTPAP
jgi:hypothetical protein